MEELTRRQKICKMLKFEGGTTPTEISDRLYTLTGEDLNKNEIIEEIEHIKKSLSHSNELLEATPPECNDCGFSDYHTIVNCPSSCPNCRSTYIKEPQFRIIEDL